MAQSAETWTVIAIGITLFNTSPILEVSWQLLRLLQHLSDVQAATELLCKTEYRNWHTAAGRKSKPTRFSPTI